MQRIALVVLGLLFGFSDMAIARVTIINFNAKRPSNPILRNYLKEIVKKIAVL